MSTSIRKYIVFLCILVSSFFCNTSVYAYVKFETEPLVNTFTLSTEGLCSVTHRYYYVDENDNRIEAKNSTVENVVCGNSISLNQGLITDLDYSEVKYFVDNSEYSQNSYVVDNDVTIDEVYYLNRYTITYKKVGSGTNPNPSVYTEMTGTITLQDPTNGAKTFTGWTWEGQTTPTKKCNN